MLPEFKDRDAKQRTEKAARLEKAIAAALARRVDDSPEMPERYSIDPLAKAAIQQLGGDAALENVATNAALGGSIADALGDEIKDQIV